MLKQVERAAKVAWCPFAQHSSLLASGSISSTFDDSFETKSTLEVFDIDLASSSNEMKLMGSVTAKDHFDSVAWGVGMKDDNNYPQGMLAMHICGFDRQRNSCTVCSVVFMVNHVDGGFTRRKAAM